jgi:hypothetical protein
MLAAVERALHRLGHLDLSPPLLTAERGNGRGEDLTRSRTVGHRTTLRQAVALACARAPRLTRLHYGSGLVPEGRRHHR